MLNKKEQGFEKMCSPDLRHFIDKQYLWNQFKNSFLTPRFLFQLIINDQDYNDVLNNRPKTNLRWFINRFLSKLLWFWPRIIEAQIWADDSENAHYDPNYYLEYDECSELLVNNVDFYADGYEIRILDLGCNIGRHLHALHELGYKNLVGVDAMPKAIKKFQVDFPEVAKDCKIHHDLFQRFLLKQPDQSIDILFTRGATIELVHPSFNIVKYMCAITKRHIILIIHETNQKYSCLYSHEFARHGFVLIKALRPVSQVLESDRNNNASLLVYQRGAVNS